MLRVFLFGLLLCSTTIQLKAQEAKETRPSQEQKTCECAKTEKMEWDLSESDKFKLYNCTGEPDFVDVKLYNRWGSLLADLERFEIKSSDFESPLKTGSYIIQLQYKIKKNDELVQQNFGLTISR